jgi:hypothetical protein
VRHTYCEAFGGTEHDGIGMKTYLGARNIVLKMLKWAIKSPPTKLSESPSVMTNSALYKFSILWDS